MITHYDPDVILRLGTGKTPSALQETFTLSPEGERVCSKLREEAGAEKEKRKRNSKVIYLREKGRNAANSASWNSASKVHSPLSFLFGPMPPL